MGRSTCSGVLHPEQQQQLQIHSHSVSFENLNQESRTCGDFTPDLKMDRKGLRAKGNRGHRPVTVTLEISPTLSFSEVPGSGTTLPPNSFYKAQEGKQSAGHHILESRGATKTGDTDQKYCPAMPTTISEVSEIFWQGHFLKH